MANVTYRAPYMGNKNKKEVHNVANQTTRCQLAEVIQAGNDVPFQSQASANQAGYDNCQHCIGGSTR